MSHKTLNQKTLNQKTSRQRPSPARQSKKKAPRKAARAAASQSGRKTTSADILGLIILALTASLAACTRKAQDAPPPADLKGSVTIRFLDVGQGDSVLITSPEGKTLLIDGGKSEGRMADLLRQYSVNGLDMVVATHADSDHITGLIEAARLRPKLFINNGLGGTTKTWERLVSAMQDAGATFQKANNQVVHLGSVQVQVLAPPDGVPSSQNDHSVGIRLGFGRFQALMTGDSEKPETQAWLAGKNPGIYGPVQVYKSIHHGAANGDHQAWLDAVKPENVVISVGPNNYGHPTQTALDLYTSNNIHIYRTDQQGTITFSGQANGKYRVQTEK